MTAALAIPATLCTRCYAPIHPARARRPTTAPTCVPCQQLIDRALSRPAPGPTTTLRNTVDSRGLPDYSGPAATAPRKVIGPDLPLPPRYDGLREQVDQTPHLHADGSLAFTTYRESPGLPHRTRAQLADSLAAIGITSLASYRAQLHAHGHIGQRIRKRARSTLESCLRDPAVTDWLAAQSRAESEAAADPGTITGQAILPAPEALIVGDTGTRRHPDSLAEVPQPHDDAASWADHFERDSLRRESDPWTPGPDGAPLGAILVTDSSGIQRTDLPWSRCTSDGCDELVKRPSPCPSCQPAKPKPADSTQAERQRRRRARRRAARVIEQAVQSQDVQRIAAAQRAAQRQVSLAVSSHPWE